MHRRTLLLAGGLAPLARPALAQPSEPSAEPTPILFIHGNGDHSALWLTTLWRFESNGYPRDRLATLDLENPLARDDDDIPQALRSSAEDFARATARAVTALRRRTGAARVALVGNSRGGFPIRQHIATAEGAAEVSHAILCGTPNHGVWDTDWRTGSEFNGRSAVLQRLNIGLTSDVPLGTACLTLRSDSQDLYAQPEGRFIGRPSTPTGVDATSPELRGATNMVLPGLDHRETAYSPRAFREIFRFITGREPASLDIEPEARPRISGRITATPGGVPTNRPLPGAQVEIFRVDATGARIGPALYQRIVRGDGAWGPVPVSPEWPLELVVSAAEHPTTHYYRQPFLRSSTVVQLRPARPPSAEDQLVPALVLFTRPRGYFGIPRDVVLLDGTEPDYTQVPRGVPASAVITARLSAERIGTPITALFNHQRMAGRAWPGAEGRIAVLELN